MAEVPVTVFAAGGDPALVARVLAEQGASVSVSGSTWEEGTATWKSGWFGAKHVLRLQHRAGYYAAENFARQLPGMTGYALKLGATEPFLAAIRSFRFAVSLVPASFGADDPTWKGVLAVARALDGVIVAPHGILDAEGRALVRGDGPPDPAAVAPTRQTPNPVLVPDGALYRGGGRAGVPAFRAVNVAALAAAGFRAPYGLPVRELLLRPADEVARRLLALNGLFAWATAPEEHLDAALAYLALDARMRALTAAERLAVGTPAGRARFARTVGWRLENMASLAWVLGHEPAPATAAGMVDAAHIEGVLAFCGGLTLTTEALLAGARPREVEEVAGMEDRFYLAHHAVRSAQMGLATVPEGFHPAVDGGVIHERRHALTWAVEPGVGWDDIDLAT